MPDVTKPFVLQMDASKWATGAVLKQANEEGKLHTCGFISHTLTPTGRNYQIYDRELKAIVKALQERRHLLLGSPHPIQVHCDHKNLTYYKEPQMLMPRQVRWDLLLSMFDLKLEHVAGTKLVEANTLSRRPDHSNNAEENEERMVIPLSMIINIINLDLKRKIQKETEKDMLAETI
jgi:RNase H-like domain found in reverse transcriptase